MEKENLIRPSLLSADFSSFKSDIDEMINYSITSAHFDVMDGTFVDQISFGQPIFKSLLNKYKGKIDFDVHLMTVNPLKQVESFYQAGSRDITFHYEAYFKGYKKLKELKKQHPDLKLGIAISPSTAVEEVFSILDIFDQVLVMSVVPGKGGQPFIEGSEIKINKLDKYRKEKNLNYIIGVDGGINVVTGPLCANNGADFLVAGSYYFKAENRKESLKKIHDKINHDNS